MLHFLGLNENLKNVFKVFLFAQMFLPIIKLNVKHVQLVLQEKGIKLLYEFAN